MAFKTLRVIFQAAKRLHMSLRTFFVMELCFEVLKPCDDLGTSCAARCTKFYIQRNQGTFEWYGAVSCSYSCTLYTCVYPTTAPTQIRSNKISLKETKGRTPESRVDETMKSGKEETKNGLGKVSDNLHLKNGFTEAIRGLWL